MSNEMPVARNLSVDELIAYYDRIIEEVDKDLFDEGVATQLKPPTIPDELVGILGLDDSGDPICPENVTDLPPRELRLVMDVMRGQTNYVAGLLSGTKKALMKGNRVVTIITSALKVYYRENGTPANQLIDSLNLDKRYLAEDRDIMKVKLRIASLEFRHETLKRNLNHLSRAQTAQQDEWNRTEGSSGGYTPDIKKDGPRKPKFRRHR